jgi:hypothetical protein
MKIVGGNKIGYNHIAGAENIKVTLSKRAVLNYFRGTNKINSAFKK